MPEPCEILGYCPGECGLCAYEDGRDIEDDSSLDDEQAVLKMALEMKADMLTKEAPQ